MFIVYIMMAYDPRKRLSIHTRPVLTVRNQEYFQTLLKSMWKRDLLYVLPDTTKSSIINQLASKPC